MSETKAISPFPMLHNNGDSKRNLWEPREKLYCQLSDALDSVRQCRPHMRNYYPYGEEAQVRYNAAVERTHKWWEMLKQIQKEILEDISHMEEQD
jgi:hypothetical protein